MVEMERIHKPYKIDSFYHFPNKDVIGFHFTLESKAIDVPGVVVNLLTVFSVNNISILGFDISQVKPQAPFEGFIYADITGKNIDPDKLLEELKDKPYVIDVKLIKPLFNGVICDTYFFPLYALGERAIIFIQRGYEGIIKRARLELGSAFNTLLYLQGFDMGLNAFQRGHRKIAGRKTERLIKLFEELFKQSGFGVMKVEEIDLERKEATIKIYDLFECELFKGSNKCESHLMRGLLAGWFSQLFKTKVVAIEVKCIAKGDPYCLFKIKPTTS